MPTLLLVRHGRTTANTAGVLAGWSEGVRLDEHGERQAAALAGRLQPLPLAAVVTSPLERCRQTAEALRALDGPDGARPPALVDERLGEVRYGDWTGRELKALAKEPLWRTVQAHPSAAVFPGPGGEGLAAMQHRAVAAVREHDARVAAEHGEDAVWVAVTHGDVIKALLADALGMHLDLFQRLSADPCSVSVVRYAPLRPFVLRTNDSGGDLAGFAPRRRKRRRAAGARPLASSDAVVGGATGT
ncbi:histidine phosphatase family protein [Kineococcus gypseus]|uniref:histidine phosphatase family protein n=1 Tax=Kineococcus gypseus TaxID=1637102 RepID=UPI003D7C78F7